MNDSTLLTMPAYVVREANAGNANDIIAPCFHCGAPISASASFSLFIGGLPRSMCCVGCQAVAQTIVDAGLDAFYLHRDEYSAMPEIGRLPNSPFNDAATSAAFSHAAAQPASPETGEVAEVREARLYLSNVTCTACIWLAEKSLSALTGMKSAKVNQATLSADVIFDSRAITLGDIVTALTRVGLGASPAGRAADTAERTLAARRQLVDWGIAILCMMQVMMLTVPLYFADPAEISPGIRQLMGWASWLITIPALLWPGRAIFIRAAKQLKAHHIGMDTPVALALALTFTTSTYNLAANTGHLYFDAITMFIALLLSARWVENSIRQKAAAKIERMANPEPQIVSCLPAFPASNARVEVNATTLRCGDIVEVPPGELIPADGTIVRGETEVDESLLTGESLPVARRERQTVIGGTVNIASPILLRVDKAGGAGVLAQLARLTESCLAYRPPFQGIADVAARYVAPITILLALIAGTVWLMVDASRSLEVMVAVLVVTCPCALALAVPAASAAALASMANSGLLVVRGHFLETLAGVTDVVFDKTGTMTTGRMALREIKVCDALDRTAVLAICAGLEAGSVHPVANAIRAAIADDGHKVKIAVASSLVLRAGAGVEGFVNGRIYRLGKPGFARNDESAFGDGSGHLPMEEADSAEKGIATTLVLSVKEVDIWRQLAVLVLTDTLRADVEATVTTLTERGINVHLLSGDSDAAVAAIADTVGIADSRVRATQTAEDKRDYIRALQAQGKRVAAIGDGVNDAPMLGVANASIGLASGAALTRLSADAVLDEGKQSLFAAIANAFGIAAQAVAITRQNFVWAIVYNAIAVPLAFAGLVNPFVAALGMAASSLIVVANASRLHSWNRSGF
jgi:P-type Cu2+ transporter